MIAESCLLVKKNPGLMLNSQSFCFIPLVREHFAGTQAVYDSRLSKAKHPQEGPKPNFSGQRGGGFH